VVHAGARQQIQPNVEYALPVLFLRRMPSCDSSRLAGFSLPAGGHVPLALQSVWRSILPAPTLGPLTPWLAIA
jgi:hypothetical protein